LCVKTPSKTRFTVQVGLEFIAAKAAAAKAAREKTREVIAKEVKRELKKYPVRETALSPDELKQYEKYAAAAIEGEADNLTQAVAYDKKGQGRNDTLFKAVCKLGWLIYHGIVDIEDVKGPLHEAFLKTRTADELEDEYQAALDEEEFIDTFNSGLDKSKDDLLRDIFANRDHGAKNGHGKSYTQPKKGKGLRFINAGTVKPKETTWICQDVIPRGKLSVLAGNPGLGKSQLSTYFAAAVTTGGSWPTAMGPIPKAELGTVIILQAEDHLDDTIVPRLMAAGADCSRVEVLQAVTTEEGADRFFNLEADLELLGDALAELNDVALIIIDPLSAYLGKTDSHNNAEVRAVLAPVAAFAEKHNVAVLGVTHLNKGTGDAINKVMGSIAFTAAPRAVWLITRDDEDEDRRLFLPIKNTNGPDGKGYAFRVKTEYIEGEEKPIKTSKVVWDSNPVTIRANDALGDSKTDGPAVGSAKDFLLQMLKDPPLDASGHRGVDSKEVKRHATEAGISWATARRAQVKLKINPVAIRDERGHVKYSLWRLPVFGDLSE
jgi:hypothetical protein